LARTCALTAVVIFASCLLLSAGMKGGRPEMAQEWMQTLGLSRTGAQFLVFAACVAEAVLGGSLLFGFRSRTVVTAGLVGASILLILHVLLAGLGEQECGCFGAANPPSPWIIAILSSGVVGCLYLQRRHQRFTGMSIRHRLGAGLVAAVALAPSFDGWLQDSEGSGPPRLVDRLRYELRMDIACVVVGTTTCKHCREVVAQRVRGSSVPIVFVTRQSDDGDLAGWGSGASIVRVDDALWWSLVLDAPPRVMWLRDRTLTDEEE